MHRKGLIERDANLLQMFKNPREKAKNLMVLLCKYRPSSTVPLVTNWMEQVFQVSCCYSYIATYSVVAAVRICLFVSS